MRYREHRPHPLLRPAVECYWSIRGRAEEPVFHRVLPDGCMDVLFDLSSGAARLLPGHPRAAAVGCMTRSLQVGYEGDVDLVAVRFRPGGATGFLGVDARELTNRVEDLQDLWGATGRDVWQRLGEVRSQPSGRAGKDSVDGPSFLNRGRVAVLDQVLLEWLDGAHHRSDPLMVDAARRITTREGRIRVGDLARGLGLSSRQLERRFAATVGASPKLASRIARFRAVVDALHREPALSLSGLAVRQGYADQAHMTRDFVGFADRPPGVYREELRSVDS